MSSFVSIEHSGFIAMELHSTTIKQNPLEFQRYLNGLQKSKKNPID